MTSHKSSDATLRIEGGDRQALHVSDLPANVVEELGSVAIPEAATAFDHEYSGQAPLTKVQSAGDRC